VYNNSKNLIILITFGVILVIGGLLVWDMGFSKEKNITSYSDDNYLYTCSKPLKAHKVGKLSGRYVPVNPVEAAKFCQITGAY
jgi:hypothetical protein